MKSKISKIISSGINYSECSYKKSVKRKKNYVYKGVSKPLDSLSSILSFWAKTDFLVAKDSAVAVFYCKRNAIVAFRITKYS